MVQNYFKIAWRALWQNKVYALVNLTGLNIGLTVVLLMVLYVQDDLSFDRFHSSGDLLYRIVQDRTDVQGVVQKMGTTGFPQGPAFETEIPEMAAFCRIKNGWNTLVKKDNAGIEESLLYTDQAMLSMFSFKTLAGNTENALLHPQNIVITDRIAEKYFGDRSPIGQVLEVGDEGGGTFKPFVVAAVVQHPPLNSSIQFDLLLSLEHLVSKDPEQRARDNNWHNANLNTFVLLQPGATAAQVAQKMTAASVKYTEPAPTAGAAPVSFHLQPLFQMHLDTEYFATNGLQYWSDGQYPKILSGLALLILLIACINFINISLARALRRTKEIGIRKATGGTRRQLVVQFMCESFLMATLAFVPALLFTRLLLPTFSHIMDKQLDSSSLFQPQTLLISGGLVLVVTVLAGAYPALVLSGFRTIESLKGQFRVARRPAISIALVVLQFVAAGVLMMGATIASQQFKYISTKDLGYKTDNILRFWLPWDQIEALAPALKHDLAALPWVEKISAKSGDWNCTRYQINGNTTDWVYYEHIDDQHLQLMGIPLVKGRYLSYQYSQDTVSNILVNEAFVKQYLSPEQDPITTPIRQRNAVLNIVGIVRDFHYASFKEAIKPIAWSLDNAAQAGCIHLQIAPNSRQQALAAIQAVYKKQVPFLPMEYHFLEDFRMLKYAEDLRWKQILDYSTLFAILIACLGLFGLTTFMTEQRTREIGIRKVLGASVVGITGLLARNFIQLVLFALVIAAPLAYYLMNIWLADFAYRIALEWWMFALAGLMAVSIALLTVGVQSMRAALANPVKSLRNE